MKLGELEYNFFEDLKLSKLCYEAATRTFPTLDKQGPKLSPVLKKLVEINLRQY